MNEQLQQSDTMPGELSSEEFDRELALRLARERAKLTPEDVVRIKRLLLKLDTDTLKIIANMVEDFEYKRRKAEEFKASMPKIALLWSAITGAVGIALTLWSNRGHP